LPCGVDVYEHSSGFPTHTRTLNVPTSKADFEFSTYSSVVGILLALSHHHRIGAMDIEKLSSSEKSRPQDVEEAVGEGEVLNASGHKQELERNFSLLSICAIGITTGNVWAALGGSIVRSFYLSIVRVSRLPLRSIG
jgi:hypothetical protein